MAIEDDVAFLGRVPLLGILGADALRILAIGAENRYLHGEEVLFHEGDAADCAYVVQDGAILIRAKVDPARRPPLTVESGGLIGEMALLVTGRRPATATAREPSNVLRLPRALFRRMLEGTPDAAERLRSHLAQRTDDMAKALDRVRTKLDAISTDSGA